MSDAPSQETIRTVALAICKSRTCEGAWCCQWPANMGRTNCNAKNGAYDDAAIFALAAIAPQPALEATQHDRWSDALSVVNSVSKNPDREGEHLDIRIVGPKCSITLLGLDDFRVLISRARSYVDNAAESLGELVQFFRGEGYSRFGFNGDAQGWSPERTAIEAMREMMAAPKSPALDPATVEACAKLVEEAPIYHGQTGYVAIQQRDKRIAGTIRALLASPAPSGEPVTSTHQSGGE